jgi:putative transposase
VFQVEKIARLFIENMLDYHQQKKYLLHEFVVMPDHFHLILTPTGITLERSMQLVKGGFSFQLNKNLKAKRDVWQPSFADRRVRDSLEYAKYKDYIWQNPVKQSLVRTPEEYPYSSAQPSFRGRRSGTAAAKAGFSIRLTAGMNACSTPWNTEAFPLL